MSGRWIVLRNDLSVAAIMHDRPEHFDAAMCDEFGPERAPHTLWQEIDPATLAAPDLLAVLREPSDETVEKVAQAIHLRMDPDRHVASAFAWGRLPSWMRGDYRLMARAAVAALLFPEGEG